MSEKRQETFTGGCFCGAVRYQTEAEPMMMASCHCRDCQRSTGAAYFPAIAVPAAALLITGVPATYATTAESGSTVTRAFCARCGTTLWAWSSSTPDGRNLSAATLDDPSCFAPMMHIFTDSAQPWDCLPPDVPRFERAPSMSR